MSDKGKNINENIVENRTISHESALFKLMRNLISSEMIALDKLFRFEIKEKTSFLEYKINRFWNFFKYFSFAVCVILIIILIILMIILWNLSNIINIK